MLYVYGVVRGDHPPTEVKGVGSPPRDVRLVTSGPLAAPVSDIPGDFAVAESDAHAHLHVLTGLLRAGPVIPLRLGTVAPDGGAVQAEILDPQRAAMAQRLDSLDGLVELHVDADDDEAEAIAAVAAVAAAAPDAGGGAMDLDAKLEFGGQIAALLMEHRRSLAEEILADLRPIAVTDTPRSLLQGPEDPVLRWAFLVKQGDLEFFDEAVVGVRSKHPSLALHYVGPLPAAHFVDWQASPEPEDDQFSGQGHWGW
jgi:hypothetical protein